MRLSVVNLENPSIKLEQCSKIFCKIWFLPTEIPTDPKAFDELACLIAMRSGGAISLNLRDLAVGLIQVQLNPAYGLHERNLTLLTDSIRLASQHLKDLCTAP